jgi:beta-hydroxylase
VESISSIKGALFATLAPGARLKRHRDPYAGSLRYHLGLVTPTHPGECRILVDGYEYSWRDGEDLIFDETFIHYAENTTDQTRIILLCDVERPLRTRFMTAVNRWAGRKLVKESVNGNEVGERFGVFHKMFLFVRARKRFKTWNRTAYFTIIYTIISVIFGSIVYSAFVVW